MGERTGIIQKGIDARYQRLGAVTETDLEGFYYPSPEEATKEALRRVKSARGNRTGILFNDIDDVVSNSEKRLRWGLNQYFASKIPGFIPVSLDEVLVAGGRYYQVPRFQEAASIIGETFSAIYQREAAKNERLHASMSANKAMQGIQTVASKSGMILAGYPTARPTEITRITAAWLKENGMQQAPVIDVSADSGNPQEAKVRYLESLLPEIPAEFHGKTFLIDDHIPTAILLQERTKGAIVPLVPEVPRNAPMISQLDAHGITHGNSATLSTHMRNIVLE